MDLAQHVPIIWRRRWLVLGASLLVALAVFAYSASRPKVYRAEALIRTPAGPVASGEATEKETLFLARTYAALATTRPVVEDAIGRSGLPLDADQAADRVGATPDRDVGFITLSATGPSAAAAVSLARGLTDALVAAVERQQAEDRGAALAPLRLQTDSLERELRGVDENDPRATSLEIRYAALLQSLAEQEARAPDVPAVVTPARADDAPISPTPRRDVLLALIAALVVNSELAVFAEARSDRFDRKNPADEVTRVTGLPVLAEVPQDAADSGAEAFHSLRTNLLFMGVSQPVRSVIVTSVTPGAGKSYSAVGLARSAADLDLSVVLVDGDLRRPVLHTRLGVERVPGVTEAMAGQTPEPMAPRVGPAALRLLPAGAAVADPSAMLTSRLGPVIAELRAALVIIDSPPSALFADAVAMALQCDASVVVVDVATSRRRDVRRLVEDLRRVGANPLGVVLNRVTSPGRPAYYYDKARPAPSAAADE